MTINLKTAKSLGITVPSTLLAAPMRRSMVLFVQINEVPHIASYETHQRCQKISMVTPKRLLQQSAQSGRSAMSDLSLPCAPKRTFAASGLPREVALNQGCSLHQSGHLTL